MPLPANWVLCYQDEDRDVLLITDPKVVQAKIDAQPREKALSEANSETIDVATFKAKEDITSAPSLWRMQEQFWMSSILLSKTTK